LQPEAGALVRGGELRERVLDRARRAARDASELVPRYRLLRDEENGFDRVGYA